MKEAVTKRIDSMIVQYKVSQGREKQVLRNRIYRLLQPHLSSCIKGYYKERKLYDSEEEILSITWDCYLKGLSTYNQRDRVSVLRHFQAVCQNHIRHTERDGRKLREVPLNVEAVDSLYASEPSAAIDGLLLLQEFRSKLNHDYQKVLDAAIDSFKDAQTNRAQGRTGAITSNRNRYVEAMRCFRMVIDFLVRRN